MTTVFLSPIGNAFNFATTGFLGLNAGKLYTYLAGTDTPQATWTTIAGNVQNANPIILGVDGRPPNEIWLETGVSYLFVLTDSDDNLIQSYDDISGINDVTVPSATIVVKDEGVTQGSASILNFTGAGVTASFGGATATINVPGAAAVSGLVAGDIVMSGASSRSGAVLCDGSAYNRVGTYADLFAAIGTTYGVGNGTTTFNVPDLQGRTAIGAGSGSGLTTRTRGQTGGAESVTLSAAESGTTAHTHTGIGTGAEAYTVPDYAPDVPQDSGLLFTQSHGSGQYRTVNASNVPLIDLSSIAINAASAAAASTAHNNMQPFGVVNYFIVY